MTVTHWRCEALQMFPVRAPPHCYDARHCQTALEREHPLPPSYLFIYITSLYYISTMSECRVLPSTQGERLVLDSGRKGQTHEAGRDFPL